MGIGKVAVGDKGTFCSKGLFGGAGIDFNLHIEPVAKERSDAKIVITLEVLDPDSAHRKSPKGSQNREIIGEGEGAVRRRILFEAEEELEEVTQDDEDSYPVLL